MSREYEWEELENEEIMSSFYGAYSSDQEPESYSEYLKDIGFKKESGKKC